MKKNIDNIFVRFGKLHLTKQDGFGNDTFHSPPASKGFYAMPIRFQEYFLISSIGSYQKNQYNLPKKLDTDNIVKEDDDELREEMWKEREKYRNKRMSELRHEFFVPNDKLVWHHLERNVKPYDIIDRHNLWIKTDVGTYIKSMLLESFKLRAETLKYFDKDEIKDINSVKKNAGGVSKDHFEVFFDTKVV